MEHHEWRFFHEMVKLFKMRKQLPAFRNAAMQLVEIGNPHLFAYIRGDHAQRLLIINTFSEHAQIVTADQLCLMVAPNNSAVVEYSLKKYA